MLGDWVIATNNGAAPLPGEVDEMLPKAGKVVGIDGDCVVLDFVDFGFILDGIDPVPLTAEILEKNGFKARGYEELVLDTDEYCFALQKGVDGINAWWWEMFSSPIIPINYVHQLQHTLRPCRIDKEIVL